MNDERMTAIWEEDGDLMRLREFFAYIHQNDDLKARIKQQTVAKLSGLPETTNIMNVADQDTNMNSKRHSGKDPDNETGQNLKNSAASKITGIFSKRPSWKNFGRKSIKMLSAAAVLVFAVYLGSSGLLEGGFGGFPLAQKSAGNDSANQSLSYGPVAPPAPAESPQVFTSSMDMKGKAEAGGAADGAYEMSSRQNMMAEEIQAVADNGTAAKIQQKIIYVMDASLKTDDVTQSVKAIEEKVSAIGGYIAESRRDNYNNQMTAYLSIRVPAAEFQSFKGELSGFGTVMNEHLYTDDVSRQYFDVETRLRSWEAQEKRYLEILQQAKTVEEILRIEDSLANVRREMESLKGQLKYWDQRVDYSEIRLNITSAQNTLTVHDPWQPVSLKSTVVAAKNAVIKSVSFIWNALNYVLIFTGYALPLIIVAAAGWLVYRIRKKSKT